MTDVTRRGILKFFGAAAIASSGVVSFASAAEALKEANIIIDGMAPGSSVWIGMTETGEELFRGHADESGQFMVHYSEEAELTVKVRKSAYRAVQFGFYNTKEERPLRLVYVKVRDC